MKCPKCNHQNKEGLNYCVQCGNFIGNTCPNCKKEVNVGNVYCGFCGSKLNPHISDQTPKERRIEERVEKGGKDLTHEFATFLKGTKQTLQYWGWALLGILLVIGAIIGIGSWGAVMKNAAHKASEMVENKVEYLVKENVKKKVEKHMSDVKRDKAYVNLRISKLLHSTHKKFVTGEEYEKAHYLEDIHYWISKARKQYEDLLEDYPTNTEFNFELGRINYNFPLLYGAEGCINYGPAIEYFEKALDYYNREEREKGWDREAYYCLGNIYYDLWKEHKRKEDEDKSIENFRNALQEPVKLDKKFLFCAQEMLDELKGQGKCECTAEHRFNGYIPE